MGKVKVVVLYTDGINREQETCFAFRKAGAEVNVLHLNQIIPSPQILDNYQIMAIPGGFSHGDDVRAGVIMANTLISRLYEGIYNFLKRDTLVIGICNGFQILTETGLLPFENFGQREAILCENMVGHLESRWVKLRVEKSDCIFTRGMEGKIIEIPVSHGEGRFVSTKENLEKIEKEKQVVFRYVDENNQPTMSFPENPATSTNSIAGICNKNGRILGMMPHPECYTKIEQHPNWTNFNEEKQPDCLPIFINAVNYFS